MGSITVKLPDVMERDLATYTAESGRYMNTSELVRDALRRHLEGHPVRLSERSPLEGVECQPEGLPVEFEPRSDDGGVLTITNPFEDLCAVIQGERIAPDKRRLGYFRVEMSPGETRPFSISFSHGSTENVYHEIQALVGEADPDGRCRSPIDPVPIGGDDPLVLRRGQCAVTK